MDDGLVRARRNLIVVSVVLILFDVAAVSIAKVSVLGTELLVGNPTVVRIFIWVVWGYFLIRYSQFLGAENDLGIKEAFLRKMDHLLRPKILEIAKQQESRWLPNSGEVGFSLLTRTRLSWSQRLFKYEPSRGERVELTSIRIPGLVILLALCRTSFYVAFMTPKVTEYVFPLALALTSPLVWFFK